MLGLNASLHYSTIPSLHSLGGKSLLQAAQKDPEARRRMERDRVRERDREIPRARNTLHEHEFDPGDRVPPSTMLRLFGIWIFLSSLPRRALLFPTSAPRGRRRCLRF